MADQLMDVISGASRGSYSFIHDNYIYRINKLTHKRVYLSCRLARCKGAGNGTKGATRGEVYGFKLSKPHNHPPEGKKIKHFEVKEYVREEARCTKDTSKEIYERAVKLFDCYELSRACVDGLVKRSRERTTGEDAGKTASRRNARKSDGGDDFYDGEFTGTLQEHEQDSETKPLVPSNEEEVFEQEKAAIEQESYDSIEQGGEDNVEHFIEVVIKGEDEGAIKKHEVPVELVEVDEGTDQDPFLLQDKLILDKHGSVSSDPDSDLDGSYSLDDTFGESDGSSELDYAGSVAPRKRLIRNDKRLPKKMRQVSGNTMGRCTNRNSFKRRRPSDCEGDRPVIAKHLSIEESLMKIFSSTFFSSKDNVFSLMNNPESIPDYDDEQNSLHSTNSLNIIKSASKLCTFASVKASQMRSLLIGKAKELDVLEDVLLEHLSNLMCFSGTDFFRKCFGRPLQEAVERGRKGDQKSKSLWTEDEIYSKIESKSETMQLAVALLCYSGKAYLALGELMDLPGPHIARKWATNSEGNPGFCAQAFAAIRSEVSACRSKTIFVCLSMEDVELKRHVGSCNGRLFGYTDLGYGRVDSDSIPEATRAVIFHASAINSHWKVPLGYCLVDNLSPQVLSNLLSQFVSKLEFNGVKCVGIVLNSSTVSARIFEEFGVISKGNLPVGALHTNADEKIRVSPFVDIMEIMESVKQLLKEKQKFLTSAGDAISWLQLESAQEFINCGDMKCRLIPGIYSVDFMNSLKSLKNKIRKDRWPFGRYYPAVMKILQNYGNNATNSSSTIKFVEHMVEITEIFLSCHRFQDRKVCITNSKNSFTAINRLLHYLESLRFPSGGFVKDEDRRMPIMNLCMNLASLKIVLRRVFDRNGGVYNRLTLSDARQFISEIKTGCELLTPVQFRERYFKFIQNLDVSPSGILSRNRRHDKLSEKFNVGSTFFTSKIYLYTPLRSMCDRLFQFFVEKTINIWMDVVDCPECFQIVLDSVHNEHSGLHKDLQRLICRVETELCVIREIPVDLIGKNLPLLTNRILNGLISLSGFKLHDHFFVSAEFGSSCHFTYLVKDLTEIYVRLRVMYLSREVKIEINDFRESSLKFSSGQFWA